MTSVDDLFKRPNNPGAGSKRKLSPTKNPNELYKSAKLSANGDAKGKEHGLNGSHRAHVDDDGQRNDDDTEAGPELPPDDDEEAPQDDEEGRFFGGGVSRDTADVLDFIDSRDGEDDSAAALKKFDSAWLRRLALSLERRISVNAELRAKFENDPAQFMRSEADLDADIKALSILTEHTEFYEEFAKLGCIASLVSLLAHDNTDIAIDTVEILSELTDEDVQADQAQWDAIVEACMEEDIASLLVDNLARLDETNEADRNGVYHCLSLLENLSSKSAVAGKLTKSSYLLKWLLSRIQKKESPVGQNTQYAAEVLSILLQSAVEIRDDVVNLNGVDNILQLLSSYRKRDPPKDTEEEEYAENLFDALVCLVDDPSSTDTETNTAGRQKFLEAEGLELLLLMLRESKSKFSKPRALRVLDHVLSGPPSSGAAEMSEKLVEAAGLKTVFSLFMKHQDHASLEHFLGVFASLLRCLPGDSPARIRTLAKFVEKEYEKLAKLVELRRDFADRLAPVDRRIKAEQLEMSEDEKEAAADEFLSRRLDAGLFCFQTIDVILSWLVAEDSGAKQKITALLAEQDKSLLDIRATLEEQIRDRENNITNEREKTQSEEAENGLEMLRTLVEFLN